jgi:hypothetical protein
MMKLPFFHELDQAQNVLIIGAGGGFDVYSGLPLYFYLRNAGKTVHLANLSFTELGFCEAERHVPSLARILPGTGGSMNYFPELYLSQWLSARFGATPVYAIERAGVKPVLAAYEYLVKSLCPDTLILIDGGADSLLRGDEAGLGTPQEDMASLFAANAVKGLARKLLVSIGFGIDAFHGVCHAQFLENVSALITDNAYLGAWSLTQEMEEFRLYREACDFATSRMPRQPSIVNSSIVSAVSGRFGNHHTTQRTEGSELFINPLMSLFWAFQIGGVARRNLYLEEISQTVSYQELSLAIETFRARQTKTRTWADIPV